MADYITNSACNGCKPKHLRGMQPFQRSALLARMMEKRDVVRFLIAPSLFGKTSLALDYAESIFSFHDVFWLNAKSPCFLRDVDKGILSKSLLSRSRVPSLVVIEDLPNLNEERAEAVCESIDVLLEKGWEVVVTMTPSRAAFEHRELDGISVRSADFLLTDDELSMLGDQGYGTSRSVRTMTVPQRIPGIAFRNTDAHVGLLKSIAEDGLSSDVLLGLFVMFALGEGDIADIEAFVGPLKNDARVMLARHYFFAGFDERRERFRSFPFSIHGLVDAFARVLPRIAATSLFVDTDSFTAHLADTLIARRDHDRACALVNGLCGVDERMAWLSSHASELSHAACLLPAHELFSSKTMRLTTETAPLFFQEAYRLMALGDAGCASELVGRVCKCPGSSDTVRASALLLGVHLAADRRARADVFKMLRGITCVALRDRTWDDGTLLDSIDRGAWCWEELVGIRLRLIEHPPIASRVIERCCASGRVGDAETAVICWALGGVSDVLADGSDSLSAHEVSVILMQANDYMRRSYYARGAGLSDASLLMFWDTVYSFGFTDASYPSLESLRSDVRALQSRVFAQRNAYDRERRVDASHSGPADKVARGHSRPGDLAAEGIPILHVRLFGGLEVSIGDRIINPELFRRQKVKTLLALLTLNQGKELMRSKLAALLWPDSTSETGQRNFYAIWSMLRRALSDSKGDCPYLHRLQYGCKLDTRSVSSDIAEFDELCNHLLFDSPDTEAWSGIYTRLGELYRGDLLPSEAKNEFILTARYEYRARLVDALVSAATRLFNQGELQASLWFAHAAVRHDSTREDAYTALMRAQISTGQRTAALDTFFRCKRYLSDELGIDPSPQAAMLYQTIITEEPNLSSFHPAGP